VLFWTKFDHDNKVVDMAIDNSRIVSELNWKPLESFSSGIRKTVTWYVDQQSNWIKTVLAGKGDEARRGLGAT